jgi:hypothetical protein
MEVMYISLYKRGGTWWSSIMIDGTVHRFTTKMSNKTDARTVEAKWRTDFHKGLVGFGTAPTVQEFSEKFLNFCAARVKPKTFRRYAGCWTRCLEFAPCSTARLDKTKDQIEPLTQWLLNEGRGKDRKYAVSSVNLNLRVIRHALLLAQARHPCSD